jgi:DNA-binding PadR family transcriptional regulator
MNISDFRGTFKFLILNILRNEPLHGYALMNKLQNMIGGHKPSASMIYPKLANLKRSGFIEIVGREGRDKKIYKITQKGTDYIEKHKEELDIILKKIKIFNEFLELGGKGFREIIYVVINKFNELSNEQKKKLSKIMQNCVKEIRFVIEFGE